MVTRYKVASHAAQRRHIMSQLPTRVGLCLDWEPRSGQKYDYNALSQGPPGFYDDFDNYAPDKLTNLYYELERSGVRIPRIICMLHTTVIKVGPGTVIPLGDYEETFLYYTVA